MRETPAQLHRRTGHPPPASDVSIARGLLGTTAGPPAEDEPCPTLYRDVGPQALEAFLEGRLSHLQGPDSLCTFLRDATLPGYSACVAQFGVLVFLTPLSLGPWMTGQPGIWVSERDRWPTPGTLAVVPGGEDLPALDAKLLDVPDAAGLREVLGGSRYDERLADTRQALRAYLEDWRLVEALSRPIVALLDGSTEAGRAAARQALEAAGLTDKDVRAPWFHLSPARRDEVRALLPGLVQELASRGGLVLTGLARGGA